MKTVLVSLLMALMFLFTSCGSEEIEPKTASEPNLPGRIRGCFLVQTDPSDGSCPAQYTMYARVANSYQWVVSGDAYFSSSTTSQQASIIPSREYSESGSFTVSLYLNGTFSCSKSFTVTAGFLCE